MPLSTAYRTHQKGVAIVATGVLVLSFDALLIRLSAAGAWDVMFWRGVLITLSLLFFLAFSGRWHSVSRLASFGKPGFYTALLQGAGGGFFVLAINHTSVANTVVLIATAPLFAAIASHFFVREMIHRRTWLACLSVLIGVAIVFGGSLEFTGASGNLYALLAALCMGSALTVLRRHPEMPRVPLVAASGVTMAVMAAPFVAPFQISPESYLVLAIMGMVQMPVALILITAGTRYLTSPEVSLFLLLETLLGPLWVWWALGETVSIETLIGGTVIVISLLLHSLGTIRSMARQASTAGNTL